MTVETEEQTYERLRWSHDHYNYPFEFVKAYHEERTKQDHLYAFIQSDHPNYSQKIEAQQVAGMSLEQCRNAISQKYFGRDYITLTADDRLCTIEDEAAEMYASACVAERDKEIERLKTELKSSRYTSEMLGYKQQNLESSQAVVTDEEIEDMVTNELNKQNIRYLDKIKPSKWLRIGMKAMALKLMATIKTTTAHKEKTNIKDIKDKLTDNK